jgi:hypothetical protein
MNDFSNEEFTYMVAAEKPDEFTGEDMTEVEIPASTWAVCLNRWDRCPEVFKRCGKEYSLNGFLPQALNMLMRPNLRCIRPETVMPKTTAAKFGYL